MEFISAEEFLRQDEKVRQMFLDWWKCELGDLFNWDSEMCPYDEDVYCINTDIEADIEGNWEYFKTQSIPLLTEGQLKRCIEDNTKLKTENPWHGVYDIYLVDYSTGQTVVKDFYSLGVNLLQAYWKVAIQIAKES